MLTAALSTTAKIWKQSTGLSAIKWINVAHVQWNIFQLLKIRESTICDCMNEPGGHCAK